MIEVLGSKFKQEFGLYGHRAEIGKVGDSKFLPHLKFLGHNDRYSFSLGLNIIGNFSPTLRGDGWLVTDNTNYELRWKPTSPREGFSDRGGFDWVIVLKKKPPVAFLNFDYDHTLLDAYHQPALTAQEVADGDERLDHVINSIAFYMSDRNSWNSPSESDEFKCGKLGHLYRVKMVDALGNQSWANWSLESASQIRLSADPSWLNAATYPVTLMPVGDTFGYTTQGASTFTIEDQICFEAGSPSSSGTATNISAYVQTTTSNKNMKCNLYTYSSSIDVGAGITNGQTAQNSVVANGVHLETFAYSTGPSVVGGTNYYLAIWSSLDTGTGIVARDTGGPTDAQRVASVVYGTWPDPPTGENSGTNINSIYCTYTPSGGAAFIPKIIMM